jgi:hypothetical protein
MEKLECPRCHKHSLPAWRKQVLGPAASTPCPKCGVRLSVPLSSLWTVAPLVLAFAASQLIESLAISAAVIVLGVVAMGWLNHKYVPLIAK